MIRAITFAALSAAVVFGGASGALAASKKETSASTVTVDPRDAYLAKRKGGAFLSWCDSDPSCNGWAEWARDVNAGKLKD